MRLEIHSSIGEVDRQAWNALGGDAHPFLRHEFFAALEQAECVGPGTGWDPLYLTLVDAQGLAAAAPAWLKNHSFGEFVFDFSWAQAYARHGLPYYPKLVLGIPFTPATGPRLLVRADRSRAELAPQLLDALAAATGERGLSSVHALFVDEADRSAFSAAGWLTRRDCQFHWSNRGYRDFEDFLAGFTAEKRKKARRERRRVQEAGIHFETRSGRDIAPAELRRAWDLHRGTFLRHGHEPYLGREFFELACASFGEALMFKLAVQGGRIVAAAIFFVGSDTLYGRYWGASDEFHSLHFETCYHQGIEYCIERGLGRFEPGTQGEHKVARGFEPALTWSAHWIADPRFRSAIADYLRREGDSVDEYAAAVQAHVPYRSGP